ncbi:MAG: OmpH family outer membrane protein [Gammaproteobacteria bacterium]
MKALINRTIAAALLVLLLGACDQLPGMGGSGTAIIDLGVIANATGEEDRIKRQAQVRRDELSAQLDSELAALEAQLNAEREKLGDSPSDEARQQFQQLTAQAQQQYSQAQQQAQQQAQRYESELVTQLRERIKPLAAEVAKSRGVSVVFLADVTLFWNDESADITDEVIGKLRADPSILTDKPAAPAEPESAENVPAQSEPEPAATE